MEIGESVTTERPPGCGPPSEDGTSKPTTTTSSMTESENELTARINAALDLSESNPEDKTGEMSSTEKRKVQKKRSKERRKARLTTSEVAGNQKESPATPGESDSGKAHKNALPEKAKNSEKFGKSEAAKSVQQVKPRKVGEPSKKNSNSKPTDSKEEDGADGGKSDAAKETGGAKRKLQSPGDLNASKKKRTGPPRNFSDVVKDDLTVNIRREGSDFDMASVNQLRASICERLDQTPAGSQRPIFESNRLEKGAFVFKCANATSRDWLLKLVEEIGAFGKARLWVHTGVPDKERQKLTLTLQDSNTATSELIFRRLSDANMGLNTTKWVLVKNLYVGPKGRTVLLMVDQETIDFIAKKGGRLYYMLQRLYVDCRQKTAPSANQTK